MLTEPLSQAELEELDRFLCSDAVPEEAMDLAMLDGFVTAAASGPNLVMPSTMLRWIWDAQEGTAKPTFAGQAEATRMVELILCHWNDVNGILNDAPEAYEPITYEREADGSTVKIIDEWCMGYFRAILLDRAAWQPLMTERPEWFATIALYGTVAGWEELKRREFSAQVHEAHAASLAHCVREIHRYWLEWRKERIARGELPGIVPKSIPHRSAPKVGCNDPCPCGSGKKYKRCHGAREQEVFDEALQPEAHTLEPNEPYPLHSPLCQTVTREGISVEVQIYEDGHGGWLLEVEDEFGNSTVWDDSFPDDAAALAEALHTIDTEGIATLVGSPPARTTQH